MIWSDFSKSISITVSTYSWLNKNKKYFLYGILATGIFGGIYLGLDQVFENNTSIIISESENVVIIFTIFGNLEINQNVLSETKLQYVENENTIVDLKAGFKIEKPNNPNWYFVKDIEELNRIRNLPPLDLNYLGGVHVNRIDTVKIAVAVFDISRLEKLDMKEYVEKDFIDFSKKSGFSFEILNKVVSPDNDYGYIEISSKNSTHSRYDVRYNQIKDDNL